MADISQATVVTGATGQLGQAIVDHLVNNGIVVVATNRSNTRLCSKSGKEEIGPGFDLTSAEAAQQLARLVATIESSRLSVVNCIGYFPGYRPFLDVGFEEANRTIQGNFTTLYFTALALIPLLMSRKGGQFIAFTSLSSAEAFPLMAAFDSAKAALEQLIRHLANEFGGVGIQANALALPTLKTSTEAKLKPRGDYEHWIEPQEVADVVRRLIAGEFGLLNGNIVKCYHYSASYYRTSYYDRVTP